MNCNREIARERATEKNIFVTVIAPLSGGGILGILRLVGSMFSHAIIFAEDRRVFVLCVG